MKRVNLFAYIKKAILKMLPKVFELIFAGIILAVLASLLTTNIIEKAQRDGLIDSHLNSISGIYIGCNKDWVDEKLGNAQFTSQKDNFLLCAYISDFYVVQMVFDQALSAQAYLVTTINNNAGIRIEIDDKTLLRNNKSTLGDFSYYDFPSAPLNILGFVSNGNARAFYAETYYFMSGGNYYDYHLASFDFGMIDGSIEDFLDQFGMPRSDIDDEVKLDMNQGVQIITNRHDVNPNTYGVSEPNIDIAELLFTYDWFNSQQLRNRLNHQDVDDQ